MRHPSMDARTSATGTSMDASAGVPENDARLFLRHALGHAALEMTLQIEHAMHVVCV